MIKCVDCGKAFDPGRDSVVVVTCCDSCQTRRLESSTRVADQSFGGWRTVETPAWYQRRIVWLVASGMMLAGVGLYAGPKAKHRYDRWVGARAVRQAAEFMGKGDLERAVLSARRAIALNPMDADANRLLAQALEKAGAPTALQWRRRLDAIRPGDAENLIAWSKDALMAGYTDTAAKVLGNVKPEDRNSAPYHDIAARIAMAQKNPEAAELLWKEAVRLDPKDQNYRVQLAMLQRKYGAGSVRGEALDALREMGTKEEIGRAAQLALLSDAMERGDNYGAKHAAEAIASAPDATFEDRLTPLSVMHRTSDPDFSRALATLRGSALAKPKEVYQLMLWMNTHELPMLALDWARELPPDLVKQVPVRVAVAEARLRVMDWDKLLKESESSPWGSFEFVRLAYRARALERTDDSSAAAEAWQKATTATEGRPERLEAMSRLAFDWRWEKRGTELLWKMTASGAPPRRVLDTLWARAIEQGSTDQLCALSKLRMNADPENVEARNNFARYSLLTRSTDSGIHALADALYKEKPANPEVVSTYALSLFQRRKIQDALAVTSALPPEQLKMPGVARYHAILLTAAGRGSEAREYFTLGESGSILPEEEALLGQAKATVSGEVAEYLRQLKDAAASSRPQDLPKLITWMNGHRHAGIVSDWSQGLAPEIASRPEVRVSIAEAHASASEWQRLDEMLASGEWRELDYLRSANLARVMHSQRNDVGQAAAWRTAAAKAAEAGPGALEQLARIAKSFGWEQECEDVLWRLALEPRFPRWAAESLWHSSLQRGSAARLARSSRLLAGANPRHERQRDSDLVAALLKRSNESAVWEFTGALRAAMPSDAILTLIHALAQHRQGRTVEADALIASLNPTSLKEPRTALFYSVFLTVAHRPDEAAKFLALSETASLWNEEKALIGSAREAADVKTK